MTDNIYKGREIPEEERKRIDERVIELEPDKFKFYEDLRRKAKNWNKQKGGKIGGKVGEYLFLLPDFFILLVRLMVDKRVSVKRKLMIGGIVAYVMLPFDIIPDFIPGIGRIDDLVLIVLGLNMVLNDTEEYILADNWSGEGDVLQQIQKVTAAAEKFLDKNLLQRIKRWLGKNSK
jgi:uncharacterized membrane protein YkvA (DUF1232 family)